MYTVITQYFKYSGPTRNTTGDTVYIKHLCPVGCVTTQSMILKMPQNKSSANTLNSKVRKFFNFTKDNYKSDLMTLSTYHPGPKGEKTFVHLTCEQCLKKAGTILKSVQAKTPRYDRHKPVAV